MEIDDNGKCVRCQGDPHTGECTDIEALIERATGEDDRRDRLLSDLDPSIFRVDIYLDSSHRVYQQLTESERLRTEQKMEMVGDAARRLATAMLKGTIKYPTDNRSINEWLEYALDDAGDTFQYLHIIREVLRMFIPEGMLKEPVHLTTNEDE